jgi:hypothetical protein
MRASCVDNTRLELLEYMVNLADQVIAHPHPQPLLSEERGFPLGLIRERAGVRVLKYVVRRPCQCGVHV